MTTASGDRVDIRLMAVAASLFVSIFSFAFPGIPNDDAYVYIRTAEIYLEQGLAAAFAHYGWAGYSVLIATLSRLGPDLLTAAYLINALCFALLVYAFVGIVELLNTHRITTSLAALTILLYPELNEFRWLVIRDVGFLAFTLTAIYLLLQYTRQASMAVAAGFTTCMLAAILFRAEATLYLLLLPLAPFLYRNKERKQRWQEFRLLASWAYGSVLAVFAAMLLAGINLWGQLLEFFSVYLPFLQTTFNPGAERTAELGRLLFGEYAATFSQDYMNGVIAAGLLVILFMSIFYGLSGAFFWMLGLGALKRYLQPAQLLQPPLLLAMAVNFLILLVFLYVTRYLSSRYAMLLCLLLATQIPVIVSRLMEEFTGGTGRRLGVRMLVLFFVYCGFDAYISFGRSRDYLLESADYVAATTAPTTAVVTNNHTIAYFSGRVADYDEVQRLPDSQTLLSTRPGDILVLEMVSELEAVLKQDEVAAALSFERAFSDSRGRQVRVYRRIAP